MPVRLLSLARVAARLDVSTKTVRRWLREGAFPPPVVMPNGTDRWHESTVDLWIVSRPTAVVGKKIPGHSGTRRDRKGQIDDGQKLPV